MFSKWLLKSSNKRLWKLQLRSSTAPKCKLCACLESVSEWSLNSFARHVKLFIDWPQLSCHTSANATSPRPQLPSSSPGKRWIIPGTGHAPVHLWDAVLVISSSWIALPFQAWSAPTGPSKPQLKWPLLRDVSWIPHGSIHSSFSWSPSNPV